MQSENDDAGPPRVSINVEDAKGHDLEDKEPAASSNSGWDGKLRVEKKLELANPEALWDPEYSDDENVVPGEQLEADEGLYILLGLDILAQGCLLTLFAQQIY